MVDDPLRRISKELLFTSFVPRASGLDEPWVLDRMAELIEAIDARPGETLFRAGEDPEFLYFLTDGRVRLTQEGRPDWVYRGRWVIGTTDALTGRPRARTATVEQPGSLFRLPAFTWLDLMEDSFDATSGALTGSAAGTVALYARVGRVAGAAASATCADTCRDLGSIVDRTLLLHQCSLFAQAGIQSLTDLARHSEVRSYGRGEELFAAGVHPGRTFVVARGEVEVHRERPDVRLSFGPGAVAGGAICLGDPQAEWSARAVSEAAVLSFSEEDLFDEMEEHTDLARSIMTAFALEREQLVDQLAGDRPEIVLD